MTKFFAGVVVVGAILFGVLSFVEFDATAIGSLALRQVSASTGIDLDASSYHIRWLRGLELENVEASARFPGGRYVVTIASMRFEHRLRSLLRRRVEVERIVLVEPRVSIVTGLEPEPAEGARAPRAGRGRRERAPLPESEPPMRQVDLDVRELVLLGGTFSLNDALSLRRVDLTFESPTLRSGALTLLHAVSGTGQLAIGELTFRTTSVDEVRTTFRMERGRIELERGSFETDQGTFAADVSLDINSIPARYHLKLAGTFMDVPGGVIFEGEGFGLDPTHLKGEGQWNVPKGTFGDAPIWRELGVTGTAHEAMEIPFTIAAGRLVVNAARIHGSVGLDGELDLVIDGRSVTGTWDAPVVIASP